MRAVVIFAALKRTVAVVAIAAAIAIAFVLLRAAPTHEGSTPVADGPWLRAVDKPIQDLVRSEAVSGRVGKRLKKTFVRGLREQAWDRFARALDDDFSGELPWPDEGWVDDRGVQIWNLPTGEHPRLGKEAFIEKVRATVGGWASVDRTLWHTFRSDAQDGTPPPFVQQRAHFDLGGTTNDGTKMELHATITAELALDETGRWKIRRLQFDDGYYTKTNVPAFRDITAWSGFSFNLSETNQEIVQSVIDERFLLTSGGVATVDYDHDGFWDLLVTQAALRTVLFVNDRKGGFIETPLPLLEDPAAVSKVYLWLDLDGDGTEELIGSRVLDQKGERAELGLYTFDKGKMARERGALSAALRASGAVITCDVNGDDLLDIFVVGYSHLDSTRQPSFIDATDGLRNLLFINKGNLRFEEESRARGISDERYSLVAECWDFDKDGDADIFVGNDFGPNNYYVNDGTGQFHDDTDHAFHKGSSFSMGVSVADFDNTGEYTLSVSNMYSHAGNRIVPLTYGIDEDQRAFVLRLAGGNSFYEPTDGSWTDTSVKRGVDVSGWAWGNQFFDFDNDGDKDLFVVNGNNTHREPDAPDY